MNYPESFKRVVFDDNNIDFIGWGNPNAKILIIGKEPAIDTSTEHGRFQYETEVVRNKRDWRENITNQTGFDEVFNMHSSGRLYGNPLWPHCWQKYKVKNRRHGVLPDGDGTSRTWYQYQKLINMIVGRDSTRDDSLDFHKYCFSTDLSVKAALNSKLTEYKETVKSIQERENLFNTDFFKQFKIIIAAVGAYGRYFRWYKFIADCFGVNEMPKWGVSIWGVDFDVHESDEYIAPEDNHLVITACQLSAPIRDEYLRKISEYVIDFARQENIELMPKL